MPLRIIIWSNGQEIEVVVVRVKRTFIHGQAVYECLVRMPNGELAYAEQSCI
jgi:hypothetical protein